VCKGRLGITSSEDAPCTCRKKLESARLFNANASAHYDCGALQRVVTGFPRHYTNHAIDAPKRRGYNVSARADGLR